MTPDYNFINYNSTRGYIPCLCGNYYWTGYSIAYLPDVSNLDAKTFGFQCDLVTDADTASWWKQQQSLIRAGKHQDATNRFIQRVNDGYGWQPLTDLKEYCYAYVYHGGYMWFSDSVPTIEPPHISSVTVYDMPDAVYHEDYENNIIFMCSQPDFDMSYIETYELSGNSAGLTVSADGFISGTPQETGTVTATVNVRDSYGASASGSTTFNVTSESAVIKSIAVSVNNTSATVGTAYTGQITATPSPVDDGTYTYSYALKSSGLGLSVDANTGAISGTPSSVGIVTVTATVTDSYNNKATGNSDITIAAKQTNNLQSVSISPSSGSATVGTAFPSTTITLTPSPSDDGSYSYSWNSPHGSGSAGFTLVKNGSTATLSGTPTTAGNCVVDGFVTDAYGVQKGASLTVTVEAAPTQPAKLNTASAEPLTAIVGVTPSINVIFDLDEADDGSYTYTVGSYTGNGTGFGYLYVSTDGGSTFKGAAQGQTFTNKPVFAISGSSYGSKPTAKGSPSFKFSISDTYNKTLEADPKVTIS